MNTIKKLFLIALLPLTIQFSNNAAIFGKKIKLENEVILTIGATLLAEPIIKSVLNTNIFHFFEAEEITNTLTDQFIRDYAQKIAPNKNIKVGICSMNSPMAASMNMILVDAEYYSTIEEILTNIDDYKTDNGIMRMHSTSIGLIPLPAHKPTEEELAIVEDFKFSIAHEIGHIKNYDTWKSIASDVAKAALNLYVYTKIMAGHKDSVKTKLVGGAVAMGIIALNETLTSWIPDIFQEKSADHYACTSIMQQDPENFVDTLKKAQEPFKNLQKNYEDYLSNPKAFIPNIDGYVLHKALYGTYKLSGSTEPFMLWLKEKSPRMYNYIFMRAEPTHPTPMARIDAIEKFIQKHSSN